MKTVEWNGVVRVGLGELTRAQQLRLSKDMTLTEPEVDSVEWGARLDESFAISAVRKVQVCVDGVWADVTAATPILFAEETHTVYPAALWNTETFRDLPVSLAHQWVTAAIAANEYLYQLAFLGTGGATSTTTTSVPPSASGQS